MENSKINNSKKIIPTILGVSTLILLGFFWGYLLFKIIN